MITLGFVPSYSDAVTVDSAFTQNGNTYVSCYITVGGAAGNIVWQNNKGEAQWLPSTLSGQTFIIGATKILSSATVNGTPRVTTATGMTWFSANQLYNSP